MAETGFIDLMSFARGAELGNQMNWRDVANDISARTNENALQQNQQAWALDYPIAQENAQSKIDAVQANREIGLHQAAVLQEASTLPESERAQFIAEAMNKRIRTLNPTTQAGAAQITAVNNMMLNQAAMAARNNDPEGAKRLLAQAAYLTNPLAGREQAIKNTNEGMAGLEAAIADPSKQFYVDQYSGKVYPLGQLRAMQQQNQSASQVPSAASVLGTSGRPPTGVIPGAPAAPAAPATEASWMERLFGSGSSNPAYTLPSMPQAPYTLPPTPPMPQSLAGAINGGYSVSPYTVPQAPQQAPSGVMEWLRSLLQQQQPAQPTYRPSGVWR